MQLIEMACRLLCQQRRLPVRSLPMQHVVFEPQAEVTIRFAGWARLVFGGGYRVVGAADGLEDRLGGASGSIAFRFGGS